MIVARGAVRILSLEDNESYFLDVPLAFPGTSFDAAEVRSGGSYEDILRRFRERGFTHVLAPEDPRGLLPLVTGEARFGTDFVPVHRAGGSVLYALRD